MARSTRFRRNQDEHRLAAWERPVTLRLATDADDRALVRLAQLDSRPLPPGPHLLGERDGRIEAAISLATGEVVADPFRRTAEICELLSRHAGALRIAPTSPTSASLKPQPRLLPA